MNVYLRDRVALSRGKRSMKRAIKMLFGFWFNLKLKVKFSTILVFKAIFLRHKSLKFFLFFFIEQFRNRRTTFIIEFFDNYDL